MHLDVLTASLIFLNHPSFDPFSRACNNFTLFIIETDGLLNRSLTLLFLIYTQKMMAIFILNLPKIDGWVFNYRIGSLPTHLHLSWLLNLLNMTNLRFRSLGILNIKVVLFELILLIMSALLLMRFTNCREISKYLCIQESRSFGFFDKEFTLGSRRFWHIYLLIFFFYFF